MANQTDFAAGPFIIDPGGKPGIRSDNNIKADRFFCNASYDQDIHFLHILSMQNLRQGI